MYLLLKSSKAKIQNHPVIKRLYQYRQLLSQLQPCFDDIIKPQIETLLQEVTTETTTKKTVVKRKLKLLSNLKPQTKKSVAFEVEEPRNKKVKLDENVGEDKDDSETSEDEDVNMEAENQVEESEEGTAKRAITYQIAKNKGLTPHRKKEQRNPRVKHKERYRKALIRRKGAVRQPRKELSKYSGEMSGIKSTVVKSIKIKT